MSKLQLPENARIALLRVALDTTGANLPVWQESPTALEAAIAALKSYGVLTESHQARDPPTLAALTVVTWGARRQDAPLPSAQDTPVTRYNLFWVNSAPETPVASNPKVCSMPMIQIPSRQGMPVAPFGMRSYQTEPHMPQLALLSPSVNSAKLIEGLGESLNIEFDHSHEDQGAVETLYLKVVPNNPTLSKADIEELPPVPPYSPPRSQAEGPALTGMTTYLNAAESSSTIKPTSGFLCCLPSSQVNFMELAP